MIRFLYWLQISFFENLYAFFTFVGPLFPKGLEGFGMILAIILIFAYVFAHLYILAVVAYSTVLISRKIFSQWQPSNFKELSLNKIVAVFMSPMFLVLIAASSMFIAPILMLLLLQPGPPVCHSELFYSNVLNQHIKDLCYFREDKSECPKSEDELKAFNSKSYERLTYCADVKFEYDESIDNIKFNVYPKTKKSFNWAISAPNFAISDREKIVQPTD